MAEAPGLERLERRSLIGYQVGNQTRQGAIEVIPWHLGRLGAFGPRTSSGTNAYVRRRDSYCGVTSNDPQVFD
jgi:hypothetical protein